VQRHHFVKKALPFECENQLHELICRVIEHFQNQQDQSKLDELYKLEIEFEKNKNGRCLYRIGLVICPIVFVLCMFFIPTPGPEQQAAVLFYGGFFTALLYGTLRSFLGVFCENCTCNKRRISILKRKIQYLKTVSFEK
jgi:hypothetical protein